MRYFLDTEFNGFGGALISLALVREDAASLYLVYGLPETLDPWVHDYVAPRLLSTPKTVEPRHVDQAEGARAIAEFLADDPQPDIIADWPEDIAWCCRALILRPGVMALVERMRFDMQRVEPYPTELEGAVEHNAWWDAMALRQRLMRHELT
jgi:hypothetical protein